MKAIIKGFIWLLGSFMAFGIVVGGIVATLDYFEINFSDDEEIKKTPSTTQKPSIKKKVNTQRPVNTDFLSEKNKKKLNEHFRNLEKENDAMEKQKLKTKMNALGSKHHKMVKSFKFKNKTCKKPTPPSQYLEEYDYNYQAGIFLKHSRRWINCVNSASASDDLALKELFISIDGDFKRKNGSIRPVFNKYCNCENEFSSLMENKKDRNLARRIMIQKVVSKWKRNGVIE